MTEKTISNWFKNGWKGGSTSLTTPVSEPRKGVSGCEAPGILRTIPALRSSLHVGPVLSGKLLHQAGHVAASGPIVILSSRKTRL